ncbi:MAG: c-type cytochrome [Pseudomonadales bacterium]|nr:c-type cytochrome [Pseudomonadales bacterium]MDG1444019.1 c-type cytochrome [Pseudomonadales bacterium]
MLESCFEGFAKQAVSLRALTSAGNSVKRLSLVKTITLLSVITLAGCETKEPQSVLLSQPTASETAQAQQKWVRSCALCHVNGEGGAPKIGDTAAWQPRLQQGGDVLLAHTLQGLNRMPPLGYCMDCSESDFRILIDFMSRGAP